MTVLEQRLYRNPLDILIEDESRTCRGCDGEHTATAFGNMITICTKTKPDGKRRHHGKRCKDYKEKERA